MGIVGVAIAVDVGKAAKATVNFFETIIEYTKEKIKESTPSFLGGYAGQK